MCGEKHYAYYSRQLEWIGQILKHAFFNFYFFEIRQTLVGIKSQH